MPRRPPLWIAVTLLTLLGTQSVSAPVAKATATLNAIHCCAQQCAQNESLPLARRCCLVRHAADSGQAIPSFTSAQPPAAAVLPVALAVGVIPWGVTPVTSTAPKDGGPLFLKACPLRL